MRLTILLTDQKCNLHCEYCYCKDEVNNHPIQGANIESISESVKKVEELTHSKVDSFCVFGGEPCLSPHFYKTLDYLNSNYPGYPITTISNGTIININDYIIDGKYKDLVCNISHDLYYSGSDKGKSRYNLLDISSDRFKKFSNTQNRLRIQSVMTGVHYSYQKQVKYLKTHLSKDQLVVIDWKPLIYSPIQDNDPEECFISLRSKLSYYFFMLLAVLKAMTSDHGIGIYDYSVRVDYKHFIDSLMNKEFVPLSCGTWNYGAYDLLGRAWYCENDYLTTGGIDPLPKVDWEFSKCKNCRINTFCRGRCTGIHESNRYSVCDTKKRQYAILSKVYKTINFLKNLNPIRIKSPKIIVKDNFIIIKPIGNVSLRSHLDDTGTSGVHGLYSNTGIKLSNDTTFSMSCKNISELRLSTYPSYLSLNKGSRHEVYLIFPKTNKIIKVKGSKSDFNKDGTRKVNWKEKFKKLIEKETQDD